MADTAKHLLHEVIPPVSVSQWVLSLPYKHRYHLAYNPLLNTKVLNCIIRAISTFYKKKAKRIYGLDKGVKGSVSVIQRFGGALNLNTHFHILFMDGVYNEDDFFLPDDDDVRDLIKKCKTLINRIFKKEGLLDDDFQEAADDKSSDQHAQSVLNFVREEKGQLKKPVEIGKIYDPPFEEYSGKRCAYLDGFSLHANSRIPGHARGALEKMCRYILRGPLAKSRITIVGQERVLLKLKTPYKSGTTHLSFTKEQFTARLMALIPPPRMNLVRYHGVFAANNKKRKSVTKKAKDWANSKKSKKSNQAPKKKSYRTPWAELLKHVFLKDVTACHRCGETLEYVATIKNRIVAKKILNHLEISTSSPTFDTARAPPQDFEAANFDTEFNQETNW